MIDPRTLTDDVLIATVARLARVERETTAELIAHLVVLEERNLHLACGFSSLFIYCRRVLHCSENGAYDRQQAARAARRFPVILAMLAGGQLHLTAVRLLAPHLKGEDHLALLGGAIHKTGEDVRELLARWFPQPDVAASVRRLPRRGRGKGAPTGHGTDRQGVGSVTAGTAGGVGREPSGAPEAGAAAPPLAPRAGGAPSPIVTSASPDSGPIAAASADGGSLVSDADETDTGTRPAVPSPFPAARPAPRPATGPRASLEPLAPGRHLFKFTGDDETVALLREAQELLSHSLPGGDVAAIVKRGLTMVVEEARRSRHGATKRPQAASGPTIGTGPAAASATSAAASATSAAASASEGEEAAGDGDPSSRHIATAVQRTVWERDSGQCAFVGRTGRRCEERRFLEYHHLRPWIAGGPPSVENIALRCRAHNQYEAQVYFAPIREAMSDA